MGEKTTFGTAAASEPWFGVRKPMKGNDQLHILRQRLYWYWCLFWFSLVIIVTIDNNYHNF